MHPPSPPPSYPNACPLPPGVAPAPHSQPFSSPSSPCSLPLLRLLPSSALAQHPSQPDLPTCPPAGRPLLALPRTPGRASLLCVCLCVCVSERLPQQPAGLLPAPPSTRNSPLSERSCSTRPPQRAPLSTCKPGTCAAWQLPAALRVPGQPCLLCACRRARRKAAVCGRPIEVCLEVCLDGLGTRERSVGRWSWLATQDPRPSWPAGLRCAVLAGNAVLMSVTWALVGWAPARLTTPARACLRKHARCRSRERERGTPGVWREGEAICVDRFPGVCRSKALERKGNRCRV